MRAKDLSSGSSSGKSGLLSALCSPLVMTCVYESISDANTK